MDQDYFDAVYFGHQKGHPKSNYQLIGGYKGETGAPELLADWVLAELSARVEKEPMVFSVLEIGCAMGDSVWAMRGRGICAFGADISSYILEQARPEVKPYLYQADIRKLFESRLVQHAPFDAIVTKDVLEHIPAQEIDGVLKDMAVLSPLQLHVVNTGEYAYQAFEGDESHVLRLPLVEWQRKARDLGIDAIIRAT